jgi:hypothetical protein
MAGSKLFPLRPDRLEFSGGKAENMYANYSNRNLTHYSYFGAFRSDVSNVGPNAAMLNQDGKLTDIGSWYMGGVATNVVPKGAGGRIQTIGLPIAASLAVFWAFVL